ncbi:MAG: ATP-dependent helicase HrpB [Rheinheimera sp.]|uniref:ATP-dependent helicase HrpB n=1 Tax=Arsukibacterium sp. UBA3189 TaxID=1946059 RepID=UPI000C3B2A5A|nr:ATP-dependent helicase HrpB [Arsukibacterium sp. UBA3189]MAA95826.1 ATP-dependent helicase HrpB [Rheinheimera sp.]MBM33582.1 ATP-dependent helicase HrpB [Rheinheimera sp.]HAW92836.1 ATP-dependent helicase HrpB [Candidatus Azambacteria bacterium]
MPTREVNAGLPVAAVLPELCQLLTTRNRVILSAPPGAGKSTWLPLQLLRHSALASGQIIMLEPRRLAAKTIAGYLAQQLNEPVGHTVGYQIRHDSCQSAATRLLIVTEGILTRKLQQDPELAGISLLIFDEFHERSLHADLALALSLEVQDLRDDLKILVMSATLDVTALERYLQAPVVSSSGRSYPVDIQYIKPGTELITIQAARQALTAFNQEPGNILVFLPGQAEINKAKDYLASQALPVNVQVFSLLGVMSLAEQQAAIAAPAAGRFKIVLATNLAETSLTIEGVNLVVDTGLCRRASFNPRHGISKLKTVAISQAAATQRAGRAGRQAPGRCFRIDTAELWQRRAAFEPAEIELAELTQLRLEIAVWGCQPADINWLTPPPEAHLAAANHLLQQFAALDEHGVITSFGRRLYQTGSSVRLANMLLYALEREAEASGLTWLAAVVAAVLEDSRNLQPNLDQQLQNVAQNKHLPQHQQARQFARRLGVSMGGNLPLQWLPMLLLRAFPDQLAQRRGQGYLLANGVGASLMPDHPQQNNEYLVVLDIQQWQQQNRIRHAVAITLDDILNDWRSQLQWQLKTGWHDKTASFSSERQRCFGQLVLQRQPVQGIITAAERQQAWLDYLSRRGLSELTWSDGAQSLSVRVQLLRQYYSDAASGTAQKSATRIDHANWPDFSQASLLANVHDWLAPYLGNISKKNQLNQLELEPILLAQLSFAQQQILNQLLPCHWQTPTGSRLKIDYLHPGGPLLSVRVQEMYGQLTTPVVLNGAIALTIALLAPGRQPLQVTRDLTSFWQNSWQDVKKEMKGRYPKHYWPDNPAEAQPTTKTKKAMLRDVNPK